MKQFFACFTSLVLAAGFAHALVASDIASNYGGSWTNNSTGGTGFLPWAISGNNDGTTIFAGTFIGSSTAGAGDINTSGVSFGLYANPVAAYINADRAFAVSLAAMDTFTFQLALNYDNGNKGFNLFAGSQGEVFNFNVGGGASVSSANAAITPITAVTYDYGGNDAVFDVTISVTSSTSFTYDIYRTSSQGAQGTLFSGNVTGLTDALSGFRLYVSGTGDGSSQNNLYANNFTVVPEPSAWLLLGIGIPFALLFAKRPAAKTARPKRSNL